PLAIAEPRTPAIPGWGDHVADAIPRIRDRPRLELHYHVTPVLEAHRVREADLALAERHADRAGAVAAAEEAHAVHEGAVGDARRDEEDVRPGGEDLLGVDALQVRDAHLPHALLLPGLGGHEAGEHAAVEATERGGGEHALGGAADPHHGVDVGAAHGGRDAGREVTVADQLDACAGLADVGDQLLVARAVEDDDDQVLDVAPERAGDRFQVRLDRRVDVDRPLGRRPDDDLLHVAVGRVQEAALVGGGEDGDRVVGAGGAEVRPLERIDGDVDLHVIGAAAPDLLADEEHGRLVALAFADDDRAAHGDRIHLLAHRLGRDLRSEERV